MPDAVRRIPVGSALRLLEEEDRLKPPDDELVPNLLPERVLIIGPSSSSSSSSSSLSSSAKENFREGFEGFKVSWEEEGDMIGLLYDVLCFIAVSAGSGVSSRYFKVVEGSMAMVLLSTLPALLLDLLRMGLRFFKFVRFMTIPPSSSSESLPYTNRLVSTSSSSSSPLTSMAMHCTTCSLK
jgi:hypothetical protein